jgi:hypothetical protein
LLLTAEKKFWRCVLSDDTPHLFGVEPPRPRADPFADVWENEFLPMLKAARITHVKALPGNPYDGHTLATVIPDMEALVGNTIARILAYKGYRGHNAPPDYKFRVFISGQKRGVTPQITRQ